MGRRALRCGEFLFFVIIAVNDDIDIIVTASAVSLDAERNSDSGSLEFVEIIAIRPIDR